MVHYLIKGVIFLVYLISCEAQSFQDDIPIQTLTNGSKYVGLLPEQTTNVDSYHVQTFALTVPENALSVDFDYYMGNLEASCSVTYFMSTMSIPCNRADYFFYFRNPFQSFLNTPCINYNDFQIMSITTATSSYSPLSPYWAVGKPWYFSFGRNNTSLKGCNYVVTPKITLCPNGTMGIHDSDTPYCTETAPYKVVQGNSIVKVETKSPGVRTYFRQDVGNGTGSVSVVLTTTDDNSYIAGGSWRAVTPANCDCYLGDYTSVSQTGTYTYSLTCNNPQKGPFYWTIFGTDAFTGLAKFYWTACPAGLSGSNCSYPITFFNSSTAKSDNYSVTVSGSNTKNTFDGAGPVVYWAFEIPEAYNNSQVNVTIKSAGTLVTYMRRDGYPDAKSNSNLGSVSFNRYPFTWTLTQFDWTLPGTMYIGFQCIQQTNCYVTLYLTVIDPPKTETKKLATSSIIIIVVILSVAAIAAAVGVGAFFLIRRRRSHGGFGSSYSRDDGYGSAQTAVISGPTSSLSSTPVSTAPIVEQPVKAVGKREFTIAPRNPVATTFRVGSRVMALHPDGQFYRAKIDSIKGANHHVTFEHNGEGAWMDARRLRAIVNEY